MRATCICSGSSTSLHRPSVHGLATKGLRGPLHGGKTSTRSLWCASGAGPDVPPDATVPAELAALAVLGSAALPYMVEGLTDYMKPRKCQSCYGAGYTPCPTCHGRGRLGGVFRGQQAQPCDTCGSRGRVRCQPCQHTGLANYWLWQPSENGGWGARGQ